MLRRLFFFLAALAFLAGCTPPSHAQVFIVANCGTVPTSQATLTAGNPGMLFIDNTGKLCTAASVSASITGFTPATTGTPIAVTTGGVTGTLPVGAVVTAFNTGATNTAYCKLGASSTTSDIAIPPASWFAFTVGGATQLTCITSTSTTTVNMVGGSGLPTGAGGGGGGTGSSAITTWAGGTLGAMANYGTSPGAVLVPGTNVFMTGSSVGAVAGTSATGALGSMVNCNSTTNPTGATTGNQGYINCNPQGGTRVQPSYGGTDAVGDPCQLQTPTIKPISITTATTTNIVTGTAAKKLYVCYLYFQTVAANNIAVISGTTGATCGANTAALVGGTTAANGLNNAANSGQAFGNGGSSVMQVQTNNDDICIITSASTPLAGVIKYVVQ